MILLILFSIKPTGSAKKKKLLLIDLLNNSQLILISISPQTMIAPITTIINSLILHLLHALRSQKFRKSAEIQILFLLLNKSLSKILILLLLLTMAFSKLILIIVTIPIRETELIQFLSNKLQAWMPVLAFCFCSAF